MKKIKFNLGEINSSDHDFAKGINFIGEKFGNIGLLILATSMLFIALLIFYDLFC